MTDRSDSAEALRKFMDSAAVIIYIVDDATDEILIVNNHYAAVLGVPSERMEGHKCWEFVNGQDAGPCAYCPRDMDLDGNGIINPRPQTIECFNPTLGIWGRCTSQAAELADGRRVHFISVIDVSNERLLRDELTRLAYYDKHMDLPNRAKLEKDLIDRPNGNFCIIAFDFISLRYINDAYGRNAGDLLMRNVIEWIRRFHLQNFEIYRVEGDEFCMLFDNADMMSASGLADRIHERFQEPWEISTGNEETCISCKVSLCVIDGRTGFDGPETILSIVERTLELSRETGAVSVYNREMDIILKRDLELEISLKNCVMDNMRGFEVHFQPIVDPRRGKWLGLEALCRWESPEFGRIPPLVFIHMAEQIGLINTVGYWVLNEAIRICAALKLHEIDGFFLDVNLSASQMSDETLVSKVLVALQRNDFPGVNLALEITESEEIDNGDYSATTIEKLRTLEIKMALDDFGTGYSNFNNLKSLPVAILKTEKQFIDDIVVDTYQQYLSYLLVELAHKAGMKLIAEGVETSAQMRKLMRNGADYFQGYLFAKPLNAADLEANIYKFKEPDPIFEQMYTEIEMEKSAESQAAMLKGAANGTTELG